MVATSYGWRDLLGSFGLRNDSFQKVGRHSFYNFDNEYWALVDHWANSSEYEKRKSLGAA
jgi:hypothetical protein